MNILRRHCPPCPCACGCRACCRCHHGCTCGKPCRAVVTTGNAVNISQDSATIVNNAFSGFRETVLWVAVQFDINPDMRAPRIAYGLITSPFLAELTLLQPATAVYYRAVVLTACGEYCFGAIQSFVTLPPLPVPMVATGDAVNITQTAATILNNTFSGMPGAIDFVAVQADTDPDMTEPFTVYGIPGSPFSVELTSLMPDTVYYYRAAVGASGEVFLGAVKSFATPATIVSVITGDATSIYTSGATIINNRFSGITGTISSVGVQRSVSPTMSSPTSVAGAIGSPFSVVLTTLQPRTTYYYRAAVNTSSGTIYGEIKSFTTPDRAYDLAGYFPCYG